ncbi:MAG TPA: methyltransferase domain-containing protein [Caldilineaceae bacterium]|nr:methyltransferase domain-containing protein [Caldilineaceae bacterium]
MRVACIAKLDIPKLDIAEYKPGRGKTCPYRTLAFREGRYLMDDTATGEAAMGEAAMGDDSIKQQVKQQFGAHAGAYATSRVHAQGASLGRLVELVNPQPAWRVLDVATAAGHTAFAFAPHVAQVVATDITPEMLPVAAKLAAEKSIANVTLEIADAEALPFGDGEFDLVTCRIAPHHFPHPARFVAEAARVLRPGGLLAVVDNVTPGGSDPEAAAAGDYVNAVEKLRDPSHHRALSLAEWRETFTAAGFTLLHVEVAPKAIEFIPWAERMGATPETVAELRRRLVEAPPAAAAYFAVAPMGSDLQFYLEEAILVGRKA